MKEVFIEKNGKITRFLYTTEKTDGLVTLDLTGGQTAPEKYTLEAQAEIPEVKIPVTGTEESNISDSKMSTTWQGSNIDISCEKKKITSELKCDATVSPVSVTVSGTLTKDAGGSSSSQNINCIGKKSFADDTTLQRIVLPRTLETIEENAFENCRELQVVEMPGNDDDENTGKEKQPADENTGNGGKNNQPAPAEKLTVQYRAFENCRKLHTVDLSGAQSLRIEAEAFAGCDSLRTVVLPENCSISENAFTGCSTDILCFVAPNGSGAGEYAREHNYRFVEK